MDELIAICMVHDVSVAIFKEVAGKLTFVDGWFDGRNPIVCSKINASGNRAVRSHFERLLSAEDFRQDEEGPPKAIAKRKRFPVPPLTSRKLVTTNGNPATTSTTTQKLNEKQTKSAKSNTLDTAQIRDNMLGQHIEQVHASDSSACIVASSGDKILCEHRLNDVYKEAMGAPERLPVLPLTSGKLATTSTTQDLHQKQITSAKRKYRL